MRVLIPVLTILSLAACLGAGIAHFQGRVTFNAYTTGFILFSVVYFVSATVWSEMRKKGPNNED